MALRCRGSVTGSTVKAPGRRSRTLTASLVATAKLNGVEPLAWLTDVLERMVSGRTKTHELGHLLPWKNWQAERLAVAAEI